MMNGQGAPPPVLVVLQAGRGTLRVEGPEAKTWLNGLVSCDVLTVTEGRGAFGLCLNKQGKIQSEVEIVAVSTGLLLGVSPGLDHKIAETLDKFLVMEDAELSVVSDAFLWADFHGLGAGPLAERAAQACGGHAAAMGFTAVGGAALVFERAALSELERFISLSPELQLATVSDWEAFRIRHGLGRFGVDFGESDNPHEAALDRRAVSWSKGCYLGQEVVCMQDMRGKLKRRLVALEVDSAELPVAGDPITSSANGQLETVGEVTSAAWSPVSGNAVALARVKGPYFEGNLPLSWAGKSAVFVQHSASE